MTLRPKNPGNPIVFALFLGVLCCFLGLQGCQMAPHTGQKDRPDAPKDTGQIAATVTTTGSEIAKNADLTQKSAQAGQKSAPELPNWVEIINFQVAIKTLTEKLSKAAADFTTYKSQSEAAVLARDAQINELEARLRAAEEQAEALKDKQKRAEAWFYQGMRAAGALLMVVSLALAFLLRGAGRYAIAGGVTGLAMVGVATFMLDYAWVTGIVVAIGSVVLAGGVGWAVWHNKRVLHASLDRLAEIAYKAASDKYKETANELVAAMRGADLLFDRRVRLAKQRITNRGID